jgi:hypothetical protein
MAAILEPSMRIDVETMREGRTTEAFLMRVFMRIGE